MIRMNAQSVRTNPAEDARTAVQPIAATKDSAPAFSPSGQQPFPLRLHAGSMPQLTGEIRSLVYIRLREVSLLVTVGWSFVLLLCFSGLDGLFNPARMGIWCIGAIMFITEKERERRFPDVSALDDALAGCQPDSPWTQPQAADWWQHHEAISRVDDPVGRRKLSGSKVRS